MRLISLCGLTLWECLRVYVWCMLQTPRHCEDIYRWCVCVYGVYLECGVRKSVSTSGPVACVFVV